MIEAFMVKILEQQGIVAVLLFLMMRSQDRNFKRLIEKNCELTRFLMDCLNRELTEEHPAGIPGSSLVSGTVIEGHPNEATGTFCHEVGKDSLSEQ